MKKLSGIIAIFITLPIWFYLLYQILVRVQASELMFFLFWIYLPATLLVSIAAGVSSDA